MVFLPFHDDLHVHHSGCPRRGLFCIGKSLLSLSLSPAFPTDQLTNIVQPLSGSIYIWAAESAGPKYARFVGIIVAWWTCTAWMTFAASNCQTTANYIVSELAVYNVNFPGGIDNDNIKWRAFIWALSEALLVLSIAMNYLPCSSVPSSLYEP